MISRISTNPFLKPRDMFVYILYTVTNLYEIEIKKNNGKHIYLCGWVTMIARKGAPYAVFLVAAYCEFPLSEALSSGLANADRLSLRKEGVRFFSSTLVATSSQVDVM